MILITGSDGFVGSGYIKLSKNKDSFHTPKSIEFDITDKSQVKAILASYDFSAIINFAALTTPTDAEKERGDKNGDYWQANVEGVKNFVDAIKEHKNKKMHFIQLSTSKVFLGTLKDKGPYDEWHEPETDLNKMSWYGYTKMEAERIIKENLPQNSAIVRLSHAVGNSESKKDFVNKLLSLIDEGKPVFKDQQISISFLPEIAGSLDIILENRKTGIFHVSSIDTTSTFELVKYYLSKSNSDKEVESIKLDEFNKSNNIPDYIYPLFGGLKVERTEKALNIKFSAWKVIIDLLVKMRLMVK